MTQYANDIRVGARKEASEAHYKTKIMQKKVQKCTFFSTFVLK